MNHEFKKPTKTETILLILLGVVLFVSFFVQKYTQTLWLGILFFIAFGLQLSIILYAVHNNKEKVKKTMLDIIFGALGFGGLAVFFGISFAGILIPQYSVVPLFGSDVSIEFLKNLIGSGMILVSNVFFSMTD